jgi:autotransporter-associated beta strand protein
VTLGASGNATLDLAGKNQTLAGIAKTANTNTTTVGNSSTTADSVLTITGTSTFDGVIANAVTGGTRTTGLAITGGTLTLGGVNTYTGNTTIAGGANLILSDNAQLRFATGVTTNGISGAGSASISGDFNIDTSFTDSTPDTSGSWALGNGNSTYTTTFQVLSGTTPWTATGDVWTKTVGTKNYSFNEATGVLTMSSTGGGFSGWAASRGLTGGDAAFDADPDHDGLKNGVEFVLGGEPNPANPGSNSAALLPTIGLDATYLTFAFRRTDDSAGLNPLAEYSTGLGTWTKAEAGVNGVTIAEDNDFYGGGTDRVVVKVPRALAAPGSKLFVHLKVTE